LAEIHMFLAIGEAKRKNEAGCPEGALHSLLIFSRQQTGTASDEKLARRGAAYAGWRRVIFERSAKLPTRPSDLNLSAAYEDALALGCSVIADRRALTPRPRKRDRRGKKHDA
jgi:hypothetical protein